MENLTPVHIGLFGHVDHGKTELARALSEKVSTSGLDKYPEAQRRQMSIDIGFTAFTLGKYLVTLVDVPGHADLIRTAVSGASIIDGAILVVSATQGPQIQTGEHLVLLESLEVGNMVVALTKVDLVDGARVMAAKESIRKILHDSVYRNAPIVAVSPITGSGIPELKERLLAALSPPKRDIAGKLKIGIDHAFPIKGVGTVVTGTIIRGRLRVNDDVEISPTNVLARVRSIQTFRESRDAAQAGDRVGISLQGIDYRSIHRGYYASSPGSLKPVNHIMVKARINRFFKHEVAPGFPMHVTAGMSSVQAKVFPFKVDENKKLVLVSALKKGEFTSYVKLLRPLVAESGDRILFSLLSLPSTTLRIAGSGVIIEIPSVSPSLNIAREKIGSVNRILRGSTAIVAGLSSSKIGGEKIVGMGISTERDIKGTVSATFGTKGLVAVDFGKVPKQGEKVILKKYHEFKID